MTSTPLTDDQQLLYDEVVERARSEAGGHYAAVLAAYARAGDDPADIEAVRLALFGAHRPTSGDAVISLVLGLVAVLVCPLPFLGIAALMYGHRARHQTATGIKGGHGLAVAGELLGWLNVVLWLAIIVGAVTLRLFAHA